MSRDDWLAPFDDALCARHERCTLCGRADGRCWCDIALMPTYAVLVMVCTRCQQADPQQVRLTALLHARYDPKRYNGKEDGC
jgi:hypothetical protein